MTKPREVIENTFFVFCFSSTFVQWKVSQALARDFCSLGHPLHWSHGIIHCPVPSQRSWTRVMAARQVSVSGRPKPNSPVMSSVPIWFTVLLNWPFYNLIFIVLLHCLFLHRTITNSLPTVALPKVPSLPLNLPQIPSFSAPTWMASLYDSTCVFLTDL